MASQEPQREEPQIAEPSRRRLHLREVRTDTADYDGIGAELRAARVRTGVELTDVAQKLRISRDYLEALELGRFDELPGDVYVFGFLRSYARFLQLDENIAIERYRSEAAGPRRDTRLEFPSAMDRGRMPTGRLLLAGLVVAILAYAGWFVLTSEERSTAERVTPVPERLAGETTAAPQRSSDISVSTAAAGVRSQGSTASSAVAAAPVVNAASDEASIADTATPTAAPSEIDAGEQTVVAAVSGAETGAPAQAVETAASSPVDDEAATEVVRQIPDAATTEPLVEQSASARAIEEATPVVEDAPASVAVEPTTDLGGEGPAQDARVAAMSPGAASEETSLPAERSFASSASDEAENATRLNQIAEASSAPLPPRTIAAPVRAPSASEVAEPAPASDAIADEMQVAARTPADAPPPLARTPDTAEAGATSGYVPRVFGAGNEDARVVLIAESDSWVQVRATSGELLLTRVLRPGDRYLVPDRSGLVMMTGNVGALRVEVDGQVVSPLGPVGVIGRDIPLDAEKLLSGDVVVREEVSP